jgi:NADH:ubiquinone oxidoreductase subunit H
MLLFSLFNTSTLFATSSLIVTSYNLLFNTSAFSLPDLIYSFESQVSAFNLISTYLDNIEYPYSTEFSFAFTTKLAGCLAFLILIRGGVPRYRYDILTKLG